MTFEDLDFEDGADTEEGAPPEESGNRMFLIIAGILGGVTLLIVACIAVYALYVVPRSKQANAMVKATNDARNTEVAFQVAETKQAFAMAATRAAYSPTPSITSIAPTVTPTLKPTDVVAVSTTVAAPTGTIQPEMATATVLQVTLTHNAALFASTQTAVAAKITESLSNTGFADDVGLPALLGIAVLLIVVIFLARRLRTA
jgi:hypothetical protein